MTTYLRGEQLTAAQLEAARNEMDPSLGGAELLDLVMRSLANSETAIRELSPATLSDPRTVGRKKLLTTVAGLLVHLAEHTQRHVGELIILVQLARME